MRPARILVVDDELELERLIKQRLRKNVRDKEIELIFAHNGKEALEKLQSEDQIDMVLIVTLRYQRISMRESIVP